MKKIIFGVFLCLTLFLGFSNPAYASEIDYASNLPSDMSEQYYFIFRVLDGRLFLFCSDYPICYVVSGYLNSYILDDDGNVFDFKGGAKYVFDNSLGSWGERDVSTASLYYNKNTFVSLASNHDILSVSSRGSFVDSDGEAYGVFFSPPPPTPIPTPTPVILTNLAMITHQATQQTNPMIQVVRAIPMMIPIVACFLGLKKALKMLQKVLSRA